MAYFRCTGTPGGSLKVRTAQGSIASFNTNLAALLRSTKCHINALQTGSGTPYPAGGGNNKLPLSDGTYSLNTVTVTINNGKVTVSGTATGSGGRLVRLSDVFTLKAGTYYIAGNTTLSGLTPFLNRSSDNTTVNNGDDESFTLSQDTDVFFGFNIINGYTYDGTALPMVNLGSSALPWEPYSNVRPIVGHSELNLTRCGVNFWNEEYESGVYQTANGEAAPDANSWRNKDIIPITPDTSYHFHKGGNQNVIVLYFYEKDGTYINYQWINANVSDDFNFTTPVNCAYLNFCLYNAASGYGLTYNNDISVSYPNTETSYHAYTGQTFTVQFGQTVYGGEYDANRGKVRVTHKSFDITHESTVIQSTSYTTQFAVGFPDFNISGNSFVKMCNEFATGTFTPSSDRPDGKLDSYSGVWNGVDGLWVAWRYDNCSTVADMLTYLQSNPIQCVYELATPIEIDVSELSVETLMGSNNVSHDCNGDTEVKYLYKA